MVRMVFASLVLVLCWGLTALPAMAECSLDRVHLRGPGGQAAFTVEIADDDAERTLGLMHRASMPRFSGMLFDFHRPAYRSFWMENTLIPLDMLFIDPRGVVQHVHHRARPLDRTGIGSQSDDIQFVLEINGGMAEVLGLEPGVEMRHPLVTQDSAAWPCE